MFVHFLIKKFSFIMINGYIILIILIYIYIYTLYPEEQLCIPGGTIMQKTRIVVIRMKEIIYTSIFIGIGILLIILLVFVLKPKTEKQNDQTSARFNAGVYTSTLSLNNTALNLEVTIDPDRITSIRLINIDDTVTTMFPLLKPALSDLESQIIEKQGTADIKMSDDSRYTQTLLLNEIDAIINEASINQEATPEPMRH